MGKRLIAILVIVFLMSCVACAAYSQDAVKTGHSGTHANRVALTPAQMKDIETKSREALKAQEWTIYLHDREGGKGVETDSLAFTDETVTSKNLAAKGYPASNFGLFVGPNGSVSWETMQTEPKTKDKAFLRGELRGKGSKMTGTIFMKPAKGGRTATYIFSTINPASVEAQAESPAKGKK